MHRMLHMHSVDKFYDGCVQNPSKKIRSGVCTYMVKKGENKRIQNQDLESGSGTSI